jgi:hypothetical protein
MGRASSSKKVARAARASGRAGTGRNWLWPAAVVVLLAVGVSLVWVSRPEGASAQSPTFGDHWHAAYGIFACDDFVPPLTDRNGDANGIHTHEDGLIHIHPTSNTATGDKATLDVFAEEIGLTLEDGKLGIPDGKTYEEGKSECGRKPGLVQLAVWDDPSDETPTIVTEDVAGLKLGQNQLITIAFAPEGADLPKPPSTDTVTTPSDLQPGGGSQPAPSVPQPSDPSTPPAAGDGSTTSAPAVPDGAGTTTTPPDGSTSTSAP